MKVDLPVESVTMEVERLGFCVPASQREARSWAKGLVQGVDVQVDRPERFSRPLVRMARRIATQTLQRVTVKHPSTLWDAIKGRYAPPWFLGRWPVQYTEREVELRAYYPDVEVPEPDRFFGVLVDGRLEDVAGVVEGKGVQ